MKTFDFQKTVEKREMKENILANLLGNASKEDLHAIFNEEKSSLGQFLLTIRDQVVKTGDQETRSALMRIKDKVKTKLLLSQDEVDLLQAFDLKCWKGMNLQGRTFSTLKNCDFTDANVNFIQVNGDVSSSTFTTCSDITVSGNMSDNTVSRYMNWNTVYGNMSDNTVSGDMGKNTVYGNMSNNTISGDMKINTVSGNMHMNKVSGSMDINTVSYDMNKNIVYGNMNNNTYRSAEYNKYGGSSDLIDPSNRQLTPEEISKEFKK